MGEHFFTQLQSLRRIRLVIIATALVLSLTSIASAVIERGRVEGVVTDPSGAKIAGAQVTLRDLTGAPLYQTGTDSEGRFSISDVAEGVYIVKVDVKGFSQSQVVKVNLRAGAIESVDVRLD